VAILVKPADDAPGTRMRKDDRSPSEIRSAEMALRKAVDTLRSLIDRARADSNLDVYVQIDSRALARIEERIEAGLRKSELRDIALWIGQIAMHWEIRYRGASKSLRPILDLRQQYAA
jgi:hypothetical protein